MFLHIIPLEKIIWKQYFIKNSIAIKSFGLNSFKKNYFGKTSLFITLKNFISTLHSYLNKGIVEKLEVVNKKWVRVRLLPGQSVDGSVSP